MARRRKPPCSRLYSCPASPERQARLGRLHDRAAMRQWAEETGVAKRVLELIVAMVREREGLSTDPKTWRLVCLSEESQVHSD